MVNTLDCKDCYFFNPIGYDTFNMFSYRTGQCKNPDSEYYTRRTIPDWKTCPLSVLPENYVAPPKKIVVQKETKKPKPKKVKRKKQEQRKLI